MPNATGVEKRKLPGVTKAKGRKLPGVLERKVLFAIIKMRFIKPTFIIKMISYLY